MDKRENLESRLLWKTRCKDRKQKIQCWKDGTII